MKSVEKKHIRQQQQQTAEEIGLVSVVSILRSMSNRQKTGNDLLLGISKKLDQNNLTSVNKLQNNTTNSILSKSLSNDIRNQLVVNISMLDVIQNIDKNLYNLGIQLNKKDSTKTQEFNEPKPNYDFVQNIKQPEVNINNNPNIDISTIIKNINDNHLESKTYLDSIDKSLKTVNRQIWFMNQPVKETQIPVVPLQPINIIQDSQNYGEINLDKLTFENTLTHSTNQIHNVLIEILDNQKSFTELYNSVNHKEASKTQKVNEVINDSKILNNVLNQATRYFNKDLGFDNKQEFNFGDTNKPSNNGINALSGLVSTTNLLLSNILVHVKKIYEFLPNLSSNPEEAKFNQGMQSKGIDLTYLIEGIQELDGVIKPSFLKNFSEFNRLLNEMLSIDSKKFVYIKISFSSLALTFKIIANKTSELSSAFRRLTLSIILVSLALISPPFLLGAAVLVGILWGIRKALTGTNILFGWNLRKLSIGILTLVASFWLMAKMPYPTLLKAIGLIAILGLAIKLFGGEHKMSFQSKSSGIFGLAMGILVLSLAFGAFGDVSVGSIIKMIGFIALLGLTLRLFPLGNRTKGMIGFSIAMLILTLSIDAFGELPFKNMLTILGFIAGLGLVFRIFPVGNRMKGMLGFAFGMAMMILAIDAAGEVPISSYLLVLGFVGALLGEIFLFNKLNKGRTSGIFGLAMGLAIMVLAVDAAREVPFSAYALVLMFVGGLLTILSLYNKQGFTKTSGLLWIAGFVTTMALSFALLQKVGLKIDTVLSFILGTALISGIVLFLGTPGFEKRIVAGSKNLLIISGVMTLASIAISFASGFDVNLNNITNFTLAVGMISVLLLAIGLIEKPIKKGALVLALISGATFIGAIAIGLLSTMPINLMNVLSFAGAIAILGVATALLGIPVVAKFVLIGSAVLLAMSLMLGLSMKGIKAVSDYKINFGNIWRFLGGVALIAASIVLLSPLTLLGSIAVIPLNLMLLGLIPAGIMLFSLSQIKPNVTNIALITAGIAILSTGIGLLSPLILIGVIVTIPLILFLGGTLVGAMLLGSIGMIKPNLKNIGLLLGGIGILSAGIALLSPLILIAGIASLPLLALMGGCLVGAILLGSMSLLNINFNNVGLFIAAIGSIVLALSVLSPLILIAGVASLLLIPIIGVSLLMALSLKLINDLTFENVGAFLFAITGITTAYALIAPLAILGLAGAILTMPIMLSALWTAAVLKAIMELELDSKNIDTFNYGLTSVVSAINSFGLVELTKSAAKAVLLLPIMGSMLLSSVVLFAISKLELSPKNIGIFNFGLKSIVKLVDGFGVVSLGKSAIKAGLLLPIMGSMLLASLVLKAISELEIDPKKMNSFGNVLTDFVDVVLESLDRNQQKLIKAQPGMDAFAKLVNIPAGLIDIIRQMADLKFNEYEVKDGKMVLKRIREFLPEDFIKIGANLAAMLNSLIDPLTIIGANTPTFKIGGVEMANPFVKSKASKGIEFLGKLSSAFKPLIDGVDKFAKLEIAQDQHKTRLMVANLLILVNGFNSVFISLNNIKFNKANVSVARINEFIDAMSSLKTDELKTINSEIDTFTNNLSNTDKWSKINSNLIVLKNNFLAISKAINSIDITKATALNRSLSTLSDKNNGENLRKLVEEFAELIGLIRTEQEETQKYRELENEKKKENEKSVQLFNGVMQPDNTNNNSKDKKTPTGIIELLGEIGTLLVGIKDATEDTVSALSEPLKVISTDGINNRIR